ncbi:N-acetylmuramoyl-L-alanine amidase [Clostridium baratii]|uniref:N-acetylmuramoyl-L-alanine amidase n=1 Tax=Clostridium baratii TaxID=1561 RepID=UPI0030CBF8E9
MSNIAIGVNDGHTISGVGSGAVGIIEESKETRRVGNELRRLLANSGVKVVNCTIDKANSVNQSLELVIQQANRQDLDWFVSIHFNAGGGRGVEVYTYKGRQYPDALEVCNNISKLGFVNRGVKEGTGLYVIRKTKAKSMLIECCFVDTDDANKYLKVGYKAIAKAIAEALIDAVNSTEESKPVIQNKPSSTTSNSNYKLVPQRGRCTVIVDELNIREKPSTKAKSVGTYRKGESVNYDHYVDNEGYRWISWIGASGNRRYMAVRVLSTNKKYGNCV